MAYKYVVIGTADELERYTNAELREAVKAARARCAEVDKLVEDAFSRGCAESERRLSDSKLAEDLRVERKNAAAERSEHKCEIEAKNAELKRLRDYCERLQSKLLDLGVDCYPF